MKNLYGKKKDYTLADLDCQYCLYHQENGKPCPLDVCCCAEEKRAALKRVQHEKPEKGIPSHLLQGTAAQTNL